MLTEALPKKLTNALRSSTKKVGDGKLDRFEVHPRKCYENQEKARK